MYMLLGRKLQSSDEAARPNSPSRIEAGLDELTWETNLLPAQE
jgi:hypothetical protein